MVLHFLISAIKRPHGRFEGKFLKKKKKSINMLIFFLLRNMNISDKKVFPGIHKFIIYSFYS